MKRSLCSLIVCATLLVVIPMVSASAQVQTGTPPLGSFAGGPDVINLGNLNVHFAVPVFHKPGRGIPFDYILSFDGSVWTPAGVSGTQTWQPVANWGWRAITEAATGYISRQRAIIQCQVPDSFPPRYYNTSQYYNFQYHDPFGVIHTGFTNVVGGCPGDIDPTDSVSTDSSGLTLHTGGGPTITTADGANFNPPLGGGTGAGTRTDRNGNQITTTNGNTFTDTLGMTVLSISGGAPNPLVFTYTDSAGTQRSVTMNYTAYTVQTNFGCSGVSEYGPISISLVSSIGYPNGTSDAITYEPTPGHAGNVTGRVQSITLPSGATITYAYAGGSNGIVCADGSTAGLTRTTIDGTTTYTRGGAGTSWITTVTDAQNNQTTINFQTATPAGGVANFYETHRTVMQGSSTVLKTSDTCYNGTVPDCRSTAITLPIKEIKTYLTLNNNQQSLNDLKMDNSGFGLPVEVDDYDFGANAPGALLRKTLLSYSSLGNGIVGLPSTVTVQDGSGSQKSQKSFSYDQATPGATSGVPQHITITGSRGNATSVSRWLDTTNSNLTTTITYDDTGNVLTSTDPGGHTTQFSYADNFADGINRNSLAYVTQVSLPDTNSPNLAHHVTKSQYDANSGLIVKAWDQNNQQTTFAYDPSLRASQVNYPDGGQTTVNYNDTIGSNSPSIEIKNKIDSTRTTDSYVQMDGYGRFIRRATANGEATPWDQTDTCYDNRGSVGFVSYGYQGNGLGQARICSGAGDTFTFDALGRTTQVMHSDGTYTQNSYNGRAWQITDEGNGSSNTSKILQSNSLQRTVGVCEVSATIQQGSSNSPSPCGLDITGSGFLTTYGYDTLGNLTTVAQGALNPRNYSYDSLSRMISKTEPESGTTTYNYNSDSLLSQRVRPQANQSSASVTTTTTYTYDPLHRLTLRSYSDSTGVSDFYNYDESAAWGAGLANTVGRMSSQSHGSPYVAGQIFSYDSMGRVTFNAQCTPRTCGTSAYNLIYSYDLLGDVLSATNGMSVTFTSTYNIAGRITGMTSSFTDAQHPGTLLSNVHYGPFGVAQATLGNGVVENYGYSSRGALQTYSSTPYSFTLGFAANGKVSSDNDSVNGNWTYGYDDLNRLSSSNKNSGQQTFTYDYDRYGNRWHQSAPLGGPATSYIFDGNNHLACCGVAYDAAGNMTNDGIGHTYTYDAEGRLSQLNGGSTTYVYDAAGRRVRVSDEFLYDLSGHAITWINTLPGTAGVWDLGEIYAGGRDLATYSFGTTNFRHADWLSTKRAMSGVNGATSQTCAGLPFADGVNCSAGNFLTYNAFTDDIHDQESNLEHTLFRQLSGTEGRWTTPDPSLVSMEPASPQSLNRYSYVLNDPVNLTDPSGLYKQKVCMLLDNGDDSNFCVYGLGGQDDPFMRDRTDIFGPTLEKAFEGLVYVPGVGFVFPKGGFDVSIEDSRLGGGLGSFLGYNLWPKWMPIAECKCKRKNRAPTGKTQGGGCTFDCTCGPASDQYNDEQHYTMDAIKKEPGCKGVTDFCPANITSVSINLKALTVNKITACTSIDIQ